jgi:hypothetical protein
MRRIYSPSDPYSWVRASIDGSFLAYHDKPNGAEGYEINVMNLANPGESIVVENRSAPPIAVPLLKTTNSASMGLWVYFVENSAGGRQIVAREVRRW